MTKIEGVGDRFLQDTKHDRDREPDEPARPLRRPRPYKTYSGAKKIELEEPEEGGGLPLWTSIRGRRSERDFRDAPMTRRELSQLLWAAQGVTGSDGDTPLRAAPSAGALYAVETYVVAHRVGEIEPGVYHYGVREHHLERIKKGDFREVLRKAALDQEVASDAGAVFLWSAVFDRCKRKYGQRAYRYVYMDAGHIAENLALAAVALGLGSCPLGAFYDNEMNQIIEVDGVEESVLYGTAVGRIR